jgi:CelD/BcsL family acetyltransferase involved in cellulose biosynthesis
MYQVDPLRDPRWTELLLRHPSASVFHTPQWMEALQRTYGYKPLVFTTAALGRDLTEGVAVCLVDSWLTGRRLISLPFSDHCDPLVDDFQTFKSRVSNLTRDVNQQKYKYIEFRPLAASPCRESGLQKSGSYCFHELDLRPPETALFRAFHKDCVQRRIRRAESEALTYEEGNSPALLRRFYELQVITRKRLQLPPQPFAWFRHLADCMGKSLKICLLSKDGKPVASIVTLRFKQTVTLKYACSDKRFSKLGCVQLLYWKAIQDAKRNGFLEMDLGRSDLDNAGLVRFKDRFGAQRSTINYWRIVPESAVKREQAWKVRAAKKLLTHLPNGWLTVAGNFFYKHFA